MLRGLEDNIKKASLAWQKRIVEEVVEFSNAPKVNDEVYAQRVAICEACLKFNPEIRQCTICSCFMDIKAQLLEYPVVIPGMDKKVKCADSDNPKW